MLIRVKTWEEFRQLIIDHDPKSISYNIEQGIPSQHLTCLRLILPVVGKQYVFIDNAVGNRLRKTGIQLHTDKSGNLYIRDEDIVEFVRAEVNRKDLKFHSYWTI